MDISFPPLPPSGRVTIPTDISDVDCRWLTDALATSHPGLTVHRAEVVESLGGACTKLRVRIETDRPDFPPTVIVKGCMEPHCEFMKPSQLREVQTSRLLPEFGVESVEILFAQEDEHGAAVMIMEDLDLRGARCLRIVKPITDFPLMAKFLSSAARIHAVWWDSRELAPEGTMSWIYGLQMPTYAEILRDSERLARTMALPRAVATPRALKDPERLYSAIESAMENRLELPLTVIHGDLNLSNLYVTSEDRPGFLDWTLRRMPWAMDVSYFIIGSLDVVDRRRWEQPLLANYLNELAAHGVDPPSFDDAWLAYRAYAVWGEMVWLLNRTDFHTEAVCTAAASRFGHAMIDLDTFNALGV